jgi:adenine-specific DNA-methyltransferase
VQISDENVHLVRNLCDEVFGVGNFVSLITYKKTSGTSSPGANLKTLSSVCDFLIWCAKDISTVKYRQLFQEKSIKDDKSAFGGIDLVPPLL